jgi:hypothetical protein
MTKTSINPKCVCGKMWTVHVHGEGMSHYLCMDCAHSVHLQAQAKKKTVTIRTPAKVKRVRTARTPRVVFTPK